MKPYQVNLFSSEEKIPEFLPAEPVFVYENKRYINFAIFDCRNIRNSEYLKETARLNIETDGIACKGNQTELLNGLKKTMTEMKKIESFLVFPDEFSAIFTLFSIFSPKTAFFLDYETSPSISTVLQHRSIEFYSHQDTDQLVKLLSTRSEKVIIIDGLYEWLGYTGPINEMVKAAKENEAVIIANEMNSFGLLGRDGRGFIDLFNLYEDINIEIGSFNRFVGGFGTYIGAKKYLINKIEENSSNIYQPMPGFMVAVNTAGLDLIKNDKNSKATFQKLWNHSRYFINRLKQIGMKTRSETPIIVVSFSNNEEAREFSRRLFVEGVIVELLKERIRLTLSIEHSKPDLDFALDKIESVAKELGITQ